MVVAFRIFTYYEFIKELFRKADGVKLHNVLGLINIISKSLQIVYKLNINIAIFFQLFLKKSMKIAC